MKITRLQEQKRVNRVNVYVDNDFVIGIKSDLVVSLGLFAGKEVDKNDIDLLLKEEEYQKCLSRAFDILSRRLQSESELRTKLKAKFGWRSIEKAINRLKELDYIDDEKFAKMWFENRTMSKGKRAVRTELIRKGVDKHIIDDVLMGVAVDDEYETAKRIIKSRKWPEMTSRSDLIPITKSLST